MIELSHAALRWFRPLHFFLSALSRSTGLIGPWTSHYAGRAKTVHRPLQDRIIHDERDVLLGRAHVDLTAPQIAAVYHGQSVLITGAGGSVGSELARQVIEACPRLLVLLDHSELALYQIDRKLREAARANGVVLRPVLASVTDAARVFSTLSQNEVSIVLHAAAYKHVALIEENEIAGVLNNVIGTQVMADVARQSGVKRFVLVSTDKAVRPKNIMGATKRLAELVVQDIQTRAPGTIFSMVRFGNVVGSSGSVVPLFQEQIAAGGPVTITHKDVSRYFMTIPEAAHLVLSASAFARGGDLFMLDMGKPVRIVDLARRIARHSGVRIRDECAPDGEIDLQITGLRRGEKLFEELLVSATLEPTPHRKIFRASPKGISELEMARILRDLATAVAHVDNASARRIVTSALSEDRIPEQTAI
ncbi:UDP-N-acetyl-alpha-D-glucosamine C6 dehydratase (plasmid) [Pseudoseohaeicola sp. NH-UV-7]|uniref:UDP-N-acetylglucosamine 4,6-dehydratase family protein n=1 Tax=Sulfitobacter sp. TBRI5 TaxID=2989732 RepID=UPI003A6EE75F